MKKILPIDISAIAFSKIVEIKALKQIDDSYCLRLGVKSAGCGIASYVIGFDTISEKDEVFELNGLKIIVEKIQLMHLAGKLIDYGSSDGEVGFIFREVN